MIRLPRNPYRPALVAISEEGDDGWAVVIELGALVLPVAVFSTYQEADLHRALVDVALDGRDDGDE